ncbi:MAG TPA: winged helix-turn-helix domain-containing protein [Microbacterium sp.]|nr:winged helix-turn-helix domain-containing protein [Microbacterium sp.]
MTEERLVLRPSDTDATAQAMSRALSSPLRLRVLRLCAFEARTNKELAELLGVNPGTMLHHVRTLVQTGFLTAQPDRAGTQGAREVPYRATGLSWNTSMPEGSPVLVETFLQQIEGLAPEELDVTWLGLKLNERSKEELQERLYRLVNEFKERGPDADGETYSLFTALHTDRNPPSARR